MFLRDLDYGIQVDAGDLDFITSSSTSNRQKAELFAQKIITTHLSQRYIVTDIFRDILPFAIGTTYKGNNLIEYTGVTAFSAAVIYVTGNRVTQAGKIYKSTAGSAAHTFNVAEWTYICDDRTLFYAILPKPAYDPDVNYAAGDQVWYKDKVYTSRGANNKNHVPTDTNYWDYVSTYSFSGQYPENTTYWTLGDNRDPAILIFAVDIAAYTLHAHVAGRQVPELRYDRNKAAIDWLKQVASGAINAGLPEIQPREGLSIEWGSSTPRNPSKY